MKFADSPQKYKPIGALFRYAAATVLAATLAACGGSAGDAGPAGKDGANGTNGTNGANGTNLVDVVRVASNATAPTLTDISAWKDLSPQITISSVDLTNKPVVKFTVRDAAGKPIVGLANSTKSATATVARYPNFGFTLAKLVPGTTNVVDGKTLPAEPSKWVSYLVTTVPTTTVGVSGTYPTTDSQGTLLDNKDGSYTYTFYRDIKQAATAVAALTDDPATYKYVADLGDVSYNAVLTHRVGVQLGGSAPGTGTNTPTETTLVTGVSMVNTANAVFDFRPDGAAITNTRDIASIDTCGSCHEKTVLAHGSRKDPRYCVTCHTDQVKYSFDDKAVNNGEAPTTGYALTGGVTGTTAKKRAEQAIVSGRAVGNFPNLIHKVHMGKDLVKTGYNYHTAGGAMAFNSVILPQSPANCAVCHDGTATSLKKTADGDNWKNNPSMLACGSCHDGINFETGKGVTLANKKADVAAGKPVGTTVTEHTGGAKANNTTCTMCHDAATIPVLHQDKIPATRDIAKRTMSATISKVAVGAADGSVNVTFSVKDGGVAVTDITKFTKPSFGLLKLAPAANGSGSHWVSYTARFRTKSTNEPMLQANTENAGALTANADGTFNYKFALLNGSTPGNINTINHAHNATTQSASAPVPAGYVGTAWTGAGATDPGTGVNVVPYEPTLTHRVAMSFQKVGAPNVDNANNAYFDFVPAGGTVTTTRNIVTMANCSTCHAGSKLHAAYDTEMCVVCHNQGTADPYTGETVDLQRLVHKLHMGAKLPSVLAGGTYVVNGAHDYSTVGYPGKIANCVTCHSESALGRDGKKLANAANWYTMPTKRACATCHDSTVAVAHVESNIFNGVETCVTCHAPGKVSDVRTAHIK